MDDLVEKYAIVNHLQRIEESLDTGCDYNQGFADGVAFSRRFVETLQPKQNNPIGYRECADAMLMMWMDDILTDGEYSSVMDKLNKSYKVGA